MTLNPQFNNRLLPLWSDDLLVTPAFVYDEEYIIEKLELLSAIRNASGCHILYSVKALSFSDLLLIIARYVDGFSVSSLFESRLAREVLGSHGSIHITSPGIRMDDLPEISGTCNYLSFNSLNQFLQNRQWTKKINCGLRVNPDLSFAGDERYDPCCKFSKLGVPLEELESVYINNDFMKEISGIHIHTNCESEDYDELVQTIDKMVEQQSGFLEQMQWLNLGGGYLLNDPDQLHVLCNLVQKLQHLYGLDIYFEPGKAIVDNAGYLVASVIDLFVSNNRKIAVVDTTINHLPEVFEYQYQPQVLQDVPGGRHEYRVVGSSCLSGDLFGDYCFDKELELGSRIIFSGVGAYMMVKANMFNGINLPSIYRLDRTGQIRQVKSYEYRDYRSRL